MRGRIGTMFGIIFRKAMQPFQINISQQQIDDLKQRLNNTRWPDEIQDSGWSYGANLSYMKELCNYWQHDFDWRKQEVFLNSFTQYKTKIDDLNIHFIWEKGEGDRSLPLLLTHGFPDSFFRFAKLIPLLTAADETGFSFDVVVPSIPGYGFSDAAATPGMNPNKIAAIFHNLMVEKLGYKKFAAQGGDWGSSVTEKLALHYPGSLFAIYITDPPYHHIFTVPQTDLTDPEKEYLKKGQQWAQKEGGYAIEQSTYPQTLAYGLNDSPAGLAAWIVEKFYRWSDNKGNIENSFTKDELLTNVSIYWFTQTINSACRIYFESAQQKRNSAAKIEVPTGAANFPKELIPAPKEFVQRFYHLKHWKEMPRGGHFAAMEEPELLAEDLRGFFREKI
jgi:pimeloyl-ACP methyl ester carboxylesterase